MGSVFKPTRIVNGKKVKYHCWYFTYIDENGRRQKNKGFRDKGATEALMKRKQKEADRRKAGLFVPEERHLQRPLAEVIADYLNHLLRQGTPKDSTHYLESKRILKTIKDKCDWKTLRDVRADAFSLYLNGMAANGRAPRTQNRHHETLRSFLNWCVDQGWLELSPIARLKMAPVGQKGRRRIRRAYTPDELHRLLAVSKDRAAVYRIAATSGLRRKELGLLEKRDCDPRGESPQWTIRGEITKNGQEARLPMSKECAETLLPFWEAAPSRTSRLLKVPHIQTLQEDQKRAGISRQDAEGRWLDFHSLRYYFCTALARSLPIQKVRILMRHSSLKLTADLYCTLGLEDVMEEVWNLPPLLKAVDGSGAGKEGEASQNDSSENSAPTGAPAASD